MTNSLQKETSSLTKWVFTNNFQFYNFIKPVNKPSYTNNFWNGFRPTASSGNTRPSRPNKLEQQIIQSSFFTGKLNRPISRSNKYAVLIGINYNGSLHKLNGCINDMYNLNRFFKTKGYLPKNIELISDEKTKLPTKARILSSLEKMLKKAKKGDNCVFTYSGHGTQTINSDGTEKDGKDECFLSCLMEKITDNEIKDVIQRNLKPGVKLFCLLDCCHSGTILDLRYNYKYTIAKSEYYENEKEVQTKGDVVMISGCMDKQVSMDAYLEGKYQGAMTNSFLKCISRSKNWDVLINNMRDTLSRESFDQIPQLSAGRKINLNNKISF